MINTVSSGAMPMLTNRLVPVDSVLAVSLDSVLVRRDGQMPGSTSILVVAEVDSPISSNSFSVVPAVVRLAVREDALRACSMMHIQQ